MEELNKEIKGIKRMLELMAIVLAVTLIASLLATDYFSNDNVLKILMVVSAAIMVFLSTRNIVLDIKEVLTKNKLKKCGG